jgi:hypothetical protein
MPIPLLKVSAARPLRESRFRDRQEMPNLAGQQVWLYTLIDDEYEQLCATEETQPREAMNRRKDG